MLDLASLIALAKSLVIMQCQGCNRSYQARPIRHQPRLYGVLGLLNQPNSSYFVLNARGSLAHEDYKPLVVDAAQNCKPAPHGAAHGAAHGPDQTHRPPSFEDRDNYPQPTGEASPVHPTFPTAASRSALRLCRVAIDSAGGEVRSQ